MKLLKTVDDVRSLYGSGEVSLGFVPTMGALHEGHLSLIRRSLQENDGTLVSIYVNPTQFNNANDLDSYPDTLSEDLKSLEDLGVGAAFLPSYEVLYPDDFAYQLDEKCFSQKLCGAARPGHFTGVLTVVMKLLNIVQPSRAYFGEKDYQQLSLIRGMANAFFLRTEIVGCPTVREPDGLAMSSRNLNLEHEDRNRSKEFYQILANAKDDSAAIGLLEAAGFVVDYIQSIDGRRYGAVVMGDETKPVRLIDNVKLGESTHAVVS